MSYYKTIQIETVNQFVEKRSRFICYACPISEEIQAIEYIKSISNKHWDAKHNVYAYRLREGQIERYSDDGEPQGTAGIPVLNVLKNLDIEDLVVVITRYFGGVLLGTGGLVRAYSHGAKLAIENSNVILMKKCKVVKADFEYGIYGKIQNIFKNFDVQVEDTQFLDDISVVFYVELEKYDIIKNKIEEISSGTINLEVLDERYCPFK